jgi:hypothetical protein
MENAIDDLTLAIVDMSNRSGDAFESLRNIALSVIRDIQAEILKLAVINPILNAILGGERSEIKDIGGLIGIILGGAGGGAGGATGIASGATELFGAGLAFGGFQHGGSRIIPGSGPSDSRSVMVSPGERVTVDTPADVASGRSRVGGDTYIIDARNADSQGLMHLEGLIRSINGSIEKRSVAANVYARERNPRLFRRRRE